MRYYELFRNNSARLLLYTLIVAIILTITTLLTSHIRPTTAAQSNPPNIILILTDDLENHPTLLGTMANLQSLLIDQGVTFTNALVPISLCCPSRVSVFTGQYAHNHDIVKNTPPDGGFAKTWRQRVEATMFAPPLQAAGYRTVLLGKYMNGYPLGSDPTYVPPGWDEWYVSKGGVNYYNYRLIENGQEVRYREKPEDYLTDVMADKAADFIRRNAELPQKPPFFIELSVYAPHGPAIPAPRHVNLYPNIQAPRGPSFNEADTSDKPRYIQALEPITSRKIGEIDAFYGDRVRSMQAVDDLIATVMDTLRETGDLANTYIIFTSDNGFHQGEHRIAKGKQSPYEESIRVPMIVIGPKVPKGVERSAVVSTIDLAPTFLDMAGVRGEALTNMDGRSLLPLLQRRAPKPSWRTAVLFEKIRQSSNPLSTASLTAEDLAAPDDEDSEIVMSEEEMVAAGITAGIGLPNFHGLRTERYSYIEYTNRKGERELYDLQADPYQLDNMIARAPAELLAVFSAQLALLRTCQGNSCRTADTFTLPDPSQTATPTPTPSAVPTLTPTPTLIRTTVPPGNRQLYMSPSRTVRVDGLRIRDEDIAEYDNANQRWKLLFDGSDVQIAKTDIDALYLWYENDILLSFDRSVKFPTLGWVDDSDIVRFSPTSLGEQTAGTWTLFFDGSDVGLTTNGEDIDGISFSPTGELLITTLGTAKVNGTTLKALDEDILAFTSTSWGSETSGSWRLYFDGSEVMLNNSGSEDLNGISMDDAQGMLFLTTKGNFQARSQNQLTGDADDIFVCYASTGGPLTSCHFGLFLNGDQARWAKDIDGITIVTDTSRQSRTMVQRDHLELELDQYEVADDDIAQDVDDEEIDNFDLALEEEIFQIFLPHISQ